MENPDVFMNHHLPDGKQDVLLDELAAVELRPLSAALARQFGVTLTVRCGVYTLKHEASGAFLQKPAGLTLRGAWRCAAHMWPCMAE